VLVIGVECDDARGLRVHCFQSCFEAVESWVGEGGGGVLEVFRASGGQVGEAAVDFPVVPVGVAGKLACCGDDDRRCFRLVVKVIEGGKAAFVFPQRAAPVGSVCVVPVEPVVGRRLPRIRVPDVKLPSLRPGERLVVRDRPAR